MQIYQNEKKQNIYSQNNVVLDCKDHAALFSLKKKTLSSGELETVGWLFSIANF